MAIGIVSFAFVGIIGMLPVGMSTFRQAINATVQSQITQQVIMQVGETSFANLGTLTATNYYFDDQGVLVADESSCIYKVAIDVLSTTTVFPSSAATDATPVPVAKLATVKIYIVNTKDPGSDKESNPKKNRSAKIVTTVAADSDI